MKTAVPEFYYFMDTESETEINFCTSGIPFLLCYLEKLLKMYKSLKIRLNDHAYSYINLYQMKLTKSA